MDKYVKFPATSPAEIAGFVIMVAATMIVLSKVPGVRKWV